MPRLTRSLIVFLSLTGLALASLGARADGYGDDRAQIINLQNRYVLAMDFNDNEAYAAVFTEDAVLDWAGGVIRGREAIRKFRDDGVYNLSRDAQSGDWPATTRHFITNQVIEVYGDTARAVTYWFQANNNAEDRHAEYGLFGHYEDELRKVDGQWLFSKRTIYNEGIKSRARAGTPNPAPPRGNY